MQESKVREGEKGEVTFTLILRKRESERAEKEVEKEEKGRERRRWKSGESGKRGEAEEEGGGERELCGKLRFFHIVHV